MTRAGLLVPLYAGALFLGSLLLFGVQPLVVKLALPRLGGSPAVWNTAQVFFQMLLLAGYLYAHLATRWLRPRVQVAVHLAVLLAAFAVLPIVLRGGFDPPATGSPVPALLATLALSVGIPFFAVATTAPLMQRWFSRTAHDAAADPYFLYSASNLGGLVALIGYPFLLEPALGLADQGVAWAVLYGLLVVLVGAAGLMLVRESPARRAEVSVPAVDDAPSWRVRARWTLLAFAPSSLMLGVTLHVSTDLAAAPFLWVIPLAIYLLTWVLTFARRPPLAHAWMLRAQPAVLAVLVLFFDGGRLAPVFVLHLLAFFVSAMVCHGELARTRPVVSRLTEFYLWISLGGVLGGVFSALFAPLVFDSVIEYPIALVLACALRPAPAGASRAERARDVALPVALALAYLLVTRYVPEGAALLGADVRIALAIGAAALLWALRARNLRFALGAALLLAIGRFDVGSSAVLAEERSFFGVSRVLADSTGRYHLLTHGTTIHGAQYRVGELFREPLTYFTRAGPAGQVFGALARERPRARIGIIGLGSGAMTCYRAPGQSMTYFEIDPLVVELAADPRYFLYLPGCGEGVRVVYGDGRRSLATVPDGEFDLFVLDAFSSDAIPAHLLTREALALFARKLAPGGVILLHVSNRHLDLAPVATAAAIGNGLEARVQDHQPSEAPGGPSYQWPSTWVLAARDAADLAPYVTTGEWRAPAAQDDSRGWTDDYSDVAGALDWRRLW